MIAVGDRIHVIGTATLQTKMGSTNYHSLQGQVTLRPVAGVSLQGSYTWSKLLGRSGGYTNPVDRGPDYTTQAGDRRHAANLRRGL